MKRHQYQHFLCALTQWNHSSPKTFHSGRYALCRWSECTLSSES